MAAPASRAIRSAAISVPLRVDTTLVANCMGLPPSFLLARHHGDAGGDQVGIADVLAGAVRVRLGVLDEVASDVALGHGVRTRAGVAVPADDVEGREVDHGHDVVAGAAEGAERRDDQRHDPGVVGVVVGPVDRRGARVRAAEDPVLQPLLDLADGAAGLRLHALPRLGQAPEVVVRGARERLVELVSGPTAEVDLVPEVRDRGVAVDRLVLAARDAKLDNRVGRQGLHLQAASDGDADAERVRRARLEGVAARRADTALVDLDGLQRAGAGAGEEGALYRPERPGRLALVAVPGRAGLTVPGA